MVVCSSSISERRRDVRAIFNERAGEDTYLLSSPALLTRHTNTDRLRQTQSPFWYLGKNENVDTMIYETSRGMLADAPGKFSWQFVVNEMKFNVFHVDVP
jgi:hypothetical protein